MKAIWNTVQVVFAAVIGLPVPEKLKNVLAQLHNGNKGNDKEDD